MRARCAAMGSACPGASMPRGTWGLGGGRVSGGSLRGPPRAVGSFWPRPGGGSKNPTPSLGWAPPLPARVGGPRSPSPLRGEFMAGTDPFSTIVAGRSRFLRARFAAPSSHATLPNAVRLRSGMPWPGLGPQSGASPSLSVPASLRARRGGSAPPAGAVGGLRPQTSPAPPWRPPLRSGRLPRPGHTLGLWKTGHGPSDHRHRLGRRTPLRGGFFPSGEHRVRLGPGAPCPGSTCGASKIVDRERPRRYILCHETLHCPYVVSHPGHAGRHRVLRVAGLPGRRMHIPRGLHAECGP